MAKLNAARSTETALEHETKLDNAQRPTITVNAESVRKHVAGGVGELAAAFYEPQQKILADNGKLYPLDASLPDGVFDTGSIEITNRFSYLQGQLTSVVCWKLETMIANQENSIVDQRKRVAAMDDLVERGRAKKEQTERLMDFLAVLLDQRSLLTQAFHAALEAHRDCTGVEYETKPERERRKEVLRDRPETEQRRRMRELGVAV